MLNCHFRKLKTFITITTIFTLGNYGIAFLLLRAVNLGFSIQFAILLYIIYFLTDTLISIPSGIIADKNGKRKVIITGYFLFVLVSLGLIYANQIWQVIIMFGLFGIFTSMTDAIQRAQVSELAEPGYKGTALGTFHTLTGLAAIPAGLIAGVLWDKISPETTFTFGLIFGITSCILLLYHMKKYD